MIQIQRPEQFTKAAARLATERQSIRRHEPGLYEVTNKAKGHSYHVRINRQKHRAAHGARPHQPLNAETWPSYFRP